MVLWTLRNIDAWRDADGGWTWNNSFEVRGGVDVASIRSGATSRRGDAIRLARWLRSEGFLTPQSAGRIRVDWSQDDCTIEVQNKVTGEPLFAFVRDEPY